MAEENNPTNTGLSQNAAAAIACIFPLVGSIVMLLLEKQNRYIRFYAIQSLCLSIAWIAVDILLQISGAIFHILPVIGGILSALCHILLFVAGLVFLVCYIVQIIKAFSGVEWEIPVFGPFARKQMAQFGFFNDDAPTDGGGITPPSGTPPSQQDVSH
jgi:uncharacterized membrane protein